MNLLFTALFLSAFTSGQLSNSCASYREHHENSFWGQIYLQTDVVTNRRLFEDELNQRFSVLVSLVWRPTFETGGDTIARYPCATTDHSNFGVFGIQRTPVVGPREAVLLETRE